MESNKAPKYCKSQNVDKLDIIRIASYHQREYDISVLRTDHDQVRSWLFRTISASSPTLGDVEPLPLEAILEIWSILDIASLFNYRHVNHRALQIVIRTRGYEVHESSCFRATAFYLEETLQGKPELPVQFDAHGDDVAWKTYSGRDRSKAKIPNHADRICWHMFPMSGYRMRQLEGSLPLKYMVTISLRYLDVESGALQNGICCSDCDIFFGRTHGLDYQAFRWRLLGFYERKCTPMTNPWNTFGNVERLKIYGGRAIKGLVSLISRDLRSVQVDMPDLVPIENRPRHFNSFK